MSCQLASKQSPPQVPPRPHVIRSRQKVVGHVTDFEEARADLKSQRQFAREHALPRTTLQAWLKNKENLNASPVLVAFFESPQGLAFAHRLVAGTHLFFHQIGACQIRLLCQFFEHVGLSPFVATSYGAQQKVAASMEREVLKFEDRERPRLSAQMAPKKISLAEDENFHEKTCLVAIEPVSNFIVVERYAEHRDAPSWNLAVLEGLQGMPVDVVQVTSDEALGIRCHVEKGLGAHHSSDVFHVQYEVSGGTSAALSAKKRQAEATYDEASQQWQQVLQHKELYEAHPGPGRPPDFVARSEAAEQKVQQAQQALAAASAHKEAMQELVRDLGRVYHPYDLKTGVATSAAELKTSLGALFHKARGLAHKAGLGESAMQRIDKAARVAPELVATLAFFFALIGARVTEYVTALALPTASERLLHKVLIPALYLQEAANKARTTAQRHTLQQAATGLLGTLRAAPQWQALGPAVQQGLWTLARECAQFFQRSSSCVEGRNGQLGLRHHHLHQISDSKLRVLTILHNYVLRRADGTTAAERFFGAPTADLFETLCDRIELPARPRKRRKAPSVPRLALAA